MPVTESPSELRDATPPGTSGWDAATGEYVESKRRSDATDDAACKARWRGVKGLDGEC